MDTGACGGADRLFARSAAGSPAASYKDLKYPALNKVRIPETTQFRMANGIQVFLVEDHELPTVGVCRQ